METTRQLSSVDKVEQPTISVFALMRFILNSGEFLWGGAVNTYLVLHLICFDCFPMLAQSNHASPWLLLASVVAVMVAILTRSPWQLMVWLLPGALFFVLWYGQNWLPKSSEQAEGIEVTIATFNVQGRRAFQNHETLEVIKDLDADIIGMQEVSNSFTDQIQTDLIDLYPHQVTLRSRDNEFALISRFPILDHDFYFEDYDRATQKSLPGYLRAVVDMDGHAIVVYVIHPPNPSMDPFTFYDDTETHDHIGYIVELVQGESLPTLVLCDCNSSPRSRQYQLLDSALDNAFAEKGWGFGMTFPSNLPVIRIDHVWYSEGFVPLEVNVWDKGGASDHRPLWTRLDLREAN